MRLDSIVPLVCSLPLLASGCVAELDPSDEGELDLAAEDERSALPPLPGEDTPLAYGMLRVANELDHTGLDIDVALNLRAANSIINHRAGADLVLGTADDQYVDSIATLDSLYWLGPTNLGKIQSYAIAEGYVPAALPAAACDPALGDAIEQCLRFVEDEATPVPGWGNLGAAPFSADLRTSCLEASDATYPSAAFFADAGLPDYLDATLGHHDLLCGPDTASLCELGVAGIASWLAPECEALYDVDPVLTEYVADPADAADWAAAVATLSAGSFDNSYWLRVYEYAPGMHPTLLGDTMGHVLYSAPIEYGGPWLQRETSDTLPPVSPAAQTVLDDVIADLGLTLASFDVGSAAEEIPCPNCHTFHDSFVLLFRDDRIVVVLDRETFWDS
ncbi:MAG: hypothetical protein AAGF11_33035 [Myxococcota bacterium]